MTNQIKFNNKSSVTIPERSDQFAVEEKDWNRIKGLITNLSLSSSYWQNGGWFMFSTTLAFFLGALSFISREPMKQIFFICSFFCLLISVLCFIADYLFASRSKKDKLGIIDEMEKMETNKP